MDNKTLAGRFELLSKLMTLHEENPFKIRSYAKAADQIEECSQPVMELSGEALSQIPGIGPAIKKKIEILRETKRFPLLEKYLETTPGGVVEMLQIRGIGPKKVRLIWKEIGIETPGELLYACEENRLTLFKGFGAKTQENIRGSVEYYLQSLGHYLYVEALSYARDLKLYWDKNFLKTNRFLPTGALRRQEDILSELEFVTNASPGEVKDKLPEGFRVNHSDEEKLTFTKNQHPKVVLYFSNDQELAAKLFDTTGTKEFLDSFNKRYSHRQPGTIDSEEALFKKSDSPEIPAFLRNRPVEEIPETKNLIQTTDIHGIIHSHSVWSDGKNTIEEMALEARRQGMEYLVISDHSRSAGYAKGLDAERVIAQQEEIDSLNLKLAPFKIFKSIESDILSDGALDYEEEILKTFDLVIASVHSNLKMEEEKAMQRLLTAVRNPYTTILGHPTGRLLLSRPGYPVNHEKLIEACSKNGVAIEINAHPRRLDLDWSWISLAREKKVLLSIDPDAHALKGLQDVQYGVLSAQKGGLTISGNLSSFALNKFEAFLLKRKKEKGLLFGN